MPWSIFDLAKREKTIAELEAKSAVPGFWDDQAGAQSAMKQITDLRRTVQPWREIEKRINSVSELVPLAEEDPSLSGELEAEVQSISERLEELEFQRAFNSPYDARNALLSIHAGAGGTESQDWAEMLMRMYLRWAERRGYKAEILDESPGEEAGIKSAIVSITGDYAYGYLKSEHGVHRLVRLSPFDADHARHTSFALVEAMPEALPDQDVTPAATDLKVETYRSSGPGGQHMQKTNSAIRITHVPTGIVVTSQSERSQHQNREIAMKLLQSHLLEIEIRRREAERLKLKGKRVEAGWGNQIRSYVLHPYKMVKDHRTDFEKGNAEAVLDGDLDGFINAYLRSIIGQDNE